MLTLENLIIEVQKELKVLQYPPNYFKRHNGIWEHFREYARQHHQEYFTEELGETYLKEMYHYPEEYPKGRLHDKVQRGVRAIRMLGDYQQFGIIRRTSRRVKLSYPEAFSIIIQNYMVYDLAGGRSEATVQNHIGNIGQFLCFACCKGLDSLSEIKSTHVSEYIATQMGYSHSTVCNRVADLRSFFKFLFQEKVTDQDLSISLPKVKGIKAQRVPPTWKPDEVEALLSSVDRGHPCGKRDYAILLLVTRLGLRRSDVENLKLTDIKWETSRIELIQRKTLQSLVLPLLNDVGEAIIDYLKHGRPQTNCLNLFVKHTAPYNEHITMGNIMTKYVCLSGLNITNKAHGLHTLRHTLASRLLEESVPLHTISAILGHANIYSTNDYLHIDIENLRRCALDFEGVCKYE